MREFVRLVGGVDSHQRHAGQPGGEFEQHPFGAVGRPHRDPVAGLEPREQRLGGPLGPGEQLAVAPLPPPRRVRVAGDQRGPVGGAFGGRAQHAADGGLHDR